jgi:hypothetical protein
MMNKMSYDTHGLKIKMGFARKMLMLNWNSITRIYIWVKMGECNLFMQSHLVQMIDARENLHVH